jgi:hypothetical protein
MEDAELEEAVCNLVHIACAALEKCKNAHEVLGILRLLAGDILQEENSLNEPITLDEAILSARVAYNDQTNLIEKFFRSAWDEFSRSLLVGKSLHF